MLSFTNYNDTFIIMAVHCPEEVITRLEYMETWGFWPILGSGGDGGDGVRAGRGAELNVSPGL